MLLLHLPTSIIQSFLPPSPSVSRDLSPDPPFFLRNPLVWRLPRHPDPSSCPHHRDRHRFLKASALRVKAAVCYPASIAWWKKNNQPNMREMHTTTEFFRTLAETPEKLVLVEFYAVGCPSCKAIHPKICQIAADNPDIDFLKVDFYEHYAFSKSLNVNILPFFQFYRGERLLDAFSCSLTKIKKLREAVTKYKESSRSTIHPRSPQLLVDL